MQAFYAALLVYLVSCAALAEQSCDTRTYALSSPTSRFQDNTDGTVTDKPSKLMWMRCSIGQRWENGACSGTASQLNWATAQVQAAQINQQGSLFFNDWRLPLLRELATITERQCSNPRINLTVFPNTPAATYWTASSRATQSPPTFAFALAFDTDGVLYADKQAHMHLRLVRNAQ